MYKTRIKTWGFAKNCTTTRVSSLLHQKKERSAIEKSSKLGSEGKRVELSRIEKYLKRKKQSLEEFTIVEKEGARSDDIDMPAPPSAPDNLCGPDTQPDLAHVQRSPAPQPPSNDHYEHNCPYQPWTKKFRLIQKFPKYLFTPTSLCMDG